jgi:hypothetical protein
MEEFPVKQIDEEDEEQVWDSVAPVCLKMSFSSSLCM